MWKLDSFEMKRNQMVHFKSPPNEAADYNYSNAHLAPHWHESIMCISLHV